MTHVEFVQHWFEHLWCRHECDVIDNMMSAEVKMHGLAANQPIGREEFRAIHTHFCAQFPDVQIQVVKAIEQDDCVSIFAEVTGTHAKSGEPIWAFGSGLARIEDGLIVETWEAWDFLSILVQLGEVPEEKLSILFGERE